MRIPLARKSTADRELILLIKLAIGCTPINPKERAYGGKRPMARMSSWGAEIATIERLVLV